MARSNKSTRANKGKAKSKNTRRKESPKDRRDGYFGKKPFWSFNLAAVDGEWSLVSDKFMDDWRKNVLNKMRSYETMKWEEINRKTGSHYVPVDRLNPEAQTRLLGMRQCEELDDVYSLRLGSKPRLFGILNSQVLKILWYDPDHLICPSNKRHT